jgi:mono/diheme cytochrome c family protein
VRTTSMRVLILTLAILILGVGTVSAHHSNASGDDISTGAQLYDKWFAVLGVQAPAGNMPIWERQTSNTRSGPDTWRCSECHGWDYKGSEGVYASGAHSTGFPNVAKLAASMPESEIVNHLKGSKDPSHDFSKYMNDADLNKLAKFLKEGIQDDSASIDAVTLKAKGANADNGKKLYDASCAACHGTDGKQKVFRTEGVNEFLGTVANRDPYRFLHRTRYGVAGVSDMPVGRDLGWKTSDSVDVLAYVQSLPSGTENEPVSNAGAGSETSPEMGGPTGGVLGGMLAGLAAVFGMLGMSALFLFGLVVLGFLIVWVLRKRK